MRSLWTARTCRAATWRRLSCPGHPVLPRVQTGPALPFALCPHVPYDAWVSTRYRRPSRRIRLRVDDSAAALEAIPWESPRDPRRVIPRRILGRPRRPPSAVICLAVDPPRAPTLRRPIKVLAAIANPVDSEAEFAAIESAVACLQAEVTRFSRDENGQHKPQERRGRTTPTQCSGAIRPTNPLASYLAELRRGYQVFHVVGHAVVREGKAALLLVDEESRSVPVVRRS